MTNKIDVLTLLSGIDIAIPELRLTVHQPTLKEIAYIGEAGFFLGAQVLTASPEKYLRSEMTEEDKKALLEKSNFEFIMTMMEEKPELRINAMMVLALLFPRHSPTFTDRFLMLNGREEGCDTAIITMENFPIVQEVIDSTIGFAGRNKEEEFNPADDRAQLIADKIRRGRQKVAEEKGAVKETSVLPRYISALGVAMNSANINHIYSLTLYQLFDQLERFNLFTSYNINLKAQLAGAKDVEQVDWLKNIH